MAKKNKKNAKLISKKTKKQIKGAAPWAAGLAAVGGMLVAGFRRGLGSKVKALVTEEEKADSRRRDTSSDGMIAQESGAV